MFFMLFISVAVYCLFCLPAFSVKTLIFNFGFPLTVGNKNCSQ